MNFLYLKKYYYLRYSDTNGFWFPNTTDTIITEAQDYNMDEFDQ